MSLTPEKEKLYEALIDSIQRSQFYNNIPLPAVLDNVVDKLNDKYGYTNLGVPEDQLPNFPKTEEEKKIELGKKLREKLKALNKRREKSKKNK